MARSTEKEIIAEKIVRYTRLPTRKGTAAPRGKATRGQVAQEVGECVPDPSLSSPWDGMSKAK